MGRQLAKLRIFSGKKISSGLFVSLKFYIQGATTTGGAIHINIQRSVRAAAPADTCMCTEFNAWLIAKAYTPMLIWNR
jgi:hypothetical protein